MTSKDVFSLFSPGSSIGGYLDEIVEIFQGGALPIQSYPLLEKALNHTILDMKGGIEQKLYALGMHVISMDGALKYNAFHGKILQVQELSALHSSIENIIKNITHQRTSGQNVWNNERAFSKSIEAIKNRFDGADILSYIGQDYEEFMDEIQGVNIEFWAVEFESSCASLESIKKRLASCDPIPQNSKTERDEAVRKMEEAKTHLKNARKYFKSLDLPNIYEECTQRRHCIAHNTKCASAYASISDMYGGMGHGRNIFFTFMIFLYVENVFMYSFKKLRSAINKHTLDIHVSG